MPSLPSSTVVMARTASRSSTSARPRISASERGSRSAIRGCLSGQETGKDERGDESPGVVLVGEIEPFARRERVGQDEPGDPLGGARRVALADEGLEHRRGDRGGGGEEHVELTE